MAENLNNNNIDELLNDIALEPDNTHDSDTIPVNKESRVQDEYHDEELNIKDDHSLELEEEVTDNFDDEIDQNFVDEKEYEVQKKQTKLQKILVSVAAGLLIVIIIGIIAYFLGFFDNEEAEKKVEIKTEKIEIKKPEVNFNDKDINVDRLNNKLNMLTKYEIIEDAKKEEEKALEKEKLHQEAQRKLEEERLAKIRRMQELEEKRLKEEREAEKKAQELMEEQAIMQKDPEDNTPITTEEESVLKITKEDKDIVVQDVQLQIEENPNTILMEKPILSDMPMVQMEAPKLEEPLLMPEPDEMHNEQTEESTLENNFIKFIVITTNKREIYKKDLEKVTQVDNNIKLCRDDSNNIEIFVGPYDENQRDIKLAVFKFAFKNKNVEAVDFTQEEFDKRCNY